MNTKSCPACGAEARWDAGKQALVCPYCGTVSPAELASDGSIAAYRPGIAVLNNVSLDHKSLEELRGLIAVAVVKVPSDVPSRESWTSKLGLASTLPVLWINTKLGKPGIRVVCTLLM
jgi:hypothetical protein